jgi:hypothetical protein
VEIQISVLALQLKKKKNIYIYIYIFVVFNLMPGTAQSMALLHRKSGWLQHYHKGGHKALPFPHLPKF